MKTSFYNPARKICSSIVSIFFLIVCIDQTINSLFTEGPDYIFSTYFV